MLLRPDETFIDEVTNRAERVFPRGSEWTTFRSHLPDDEVFKNSILDPAIGVGGELALKTFASADWQNWVASAQIGLYEIGTRIGLPRLQGTSLAQGMSTVYSHLGSTLNTIQAYENPAEMIPELIQNTGMQVVQQITGQSGMVSQTVAQVVAAAVWAVNVGRAKVHADLAKDVPLPPLQSEDPATDTWQMNRVFEVFRSRGTGGGVVYPDGEVVAASNANYTSFFLPAYRTDGQWEIQHRHQGIAAQQGRPRVARGPRGETQYRFDPGDGSSFGFMPGTTTTLRVLQASYRYYHSVRGTPVDRYALRCKGIDRPCYKSVKTFDGSRDCRQCVDPESVWPVKGVGWAYGGSPLNATTPGENVGEFYLSTNKFLLNLLDSIAKPGPLLYTVNTDRIFEEWKESFELFWEFMRSQWKAHRGSGWRGLLSRLATTMTAFERDGEVHLGGRNPRMPAKLIASARAPTFDIPFSDSIFARLIAPYCTDLVRMQLRELETLSVAYVPPGVGALYFSNGKILRNKLGDRFESSRRELLASSKRMLVDLRRVTDPEYRKALEDSGVKASTVNPLLHGSPGIEGELLRPSNKPPRALKPPRVARQPPLGATVLLTNPVRLGQGGSKEGTTAKQGNQREIWAVLAGSAALTAAAGVAFYQLSKDDRDPEPQ
ncbi:hypothetical protein PPSIR1_19067 [Plesiocystis pacifica SIR-1]|uniref:Uncharacterized protein n=1 Tax=Plesiocystis pacifica SIR-1 TaxID=391625 RepID=A6GGN0_9BACT|nr:hypothetical protein [Plesiocystis pacifica]EDM74990.1 hypothetical protein PPSIR1_19067 [Plesiocystis pacifica SIR-1]